MKNNIQSVIDSTDEYQSLNHANPELRLWYRFMPDDKGTIFNRVWRICRSSHNILPDGIYENFVDGSIMIRI